MVMMGTSRSAGSVWFLLAVFFLLAGATPSAQDGTLSGIVTDATGTRLPGVRVEASNQDAAGAAVTDGAGRYLIAGLTPGVYAVLFTQPGFAPVVRGGVTVGAASPATLDVRLDLGEVTEDVTVTAPATGSLIAPRAEFDERAPVRTLAADRLALGGAVQVVDVLRDVTANTGSTLANEQSFLQGTSQFSLRGLGQASTLTLVNGRRAGIAPVGDNTANDFFDINTLPFTMIERIDVLLEGASSTYGSQAVAGVANIVTRKGFEGFEVVGGLRDASNRAADVGFALGQRFARGRFNVYGAHYRHGENFRTDFAWLHDRAIDPDGDGNIVDGSFDTGVGSPGSYRRAAGGPGNTYAPYRVTNPRGESVLAGRHPDADCAAAGGHPDGRDCRMDFSDQRTVIAAEDRYQLFAEADYALSDALTLFTELGGSANVVTDRQGAMWFRNGNVAGTGEVFIPADHPFNFWTDPDGDGVLTYVEPDDWDPLRHEAVDLGCICRPLGADGNGVNGGFERRSFNNLRMMGGLNVDLGPRWRGTGYFSHASSHFIAMSERRWIADAFNGAVLDGRWNPFGTRLARPDLVTPKTVEGDGLDPASVGRTAGNAPRTQALFDGTGVATARTVEQVAEFIATGDAGQLRGRPVGLALGAQYRSTEYDRRPDPLQAAGEGPLPTRDFPAASRQQAFALFAETIVPVSERLDVQVPLRYERYDVAGSTVDPKLGARFNAADWLVLRGSAGTAFRAPSLLQLAGNITTINLNDPFTEAGVCNVIAGNIEPTGLSFLTVSMLEGGDLEPQTAGVYNVGAVLTPRRGARVNVDFWSFDYRDVIAQDRSFQAILDDDCYDDGIPNHPRVQRDAAGQLSVVTAEFANVGVVRTHGVDFGGGFNAEWGRSRLDVDAGMTLLTRFDIDDGSGGFTNQLGNRNFRNGFGPTPRIRYHAGATWTRGPQAANLTIRYIDAYRNDAVGALPFIDDWMTVEAYYARQLDSRLTLVVGVNNLLDADPPGLPSGKGGSQAYNLRPAYDGQVHDIRGRALYARFRYRL